MFKPEEKKTAGASAPADPPAAAPEIKAAGTEAPAYNPQYARKDPSARYMAEIHEMAVSGESLHAAMGTLLPLPKWEDILLLGSQLDPPPLNDGDPVNTRTVIGKHAGRPMVLESPI